VISFSGRFGVILAPVSLPPCPGSITTTKGGVAGRRTGGGSAPGSTASPGPRGCTPDSVEGCVCGVDGDEAVTFGVGGAGAALIRIVRPLSANCASNGAPALIVRVATPFFSS